jgi:hypothetical protein
MKALLLVVSKENSENPEAYPSLASIAKEVSSANLQLPATQNIA